MARKVMTEDQILGIRSAVIDAFNASEAHGKSLTAAVLAGQIHNVGEISAAMTVLALPPLPILSTADRSTRIFG